MSFKRKKNWREVLYYPTEEEQHNLIRMRSDFIALLIFIGGIIFFYNHFIAFIISIIVLLLSGYNIFYRIKHGIKYPYLKQKIFQIFYCIFVLGVFIFLFVQLVNENSQKINSAPNNSFAKEEELSIQKRNNITDSSQKALFILASRAYLMINNSSWSYGWDKNKINYLGIKVENSGKTPAYNIRSAHFIASPKFRQISKQEIKNLTVDSAQPEVCPSNKEIQINVYPEKQNPTIYSDTVYIFGIIFYNDIFKVVHHTWFNGRFIAGEFTPIGNQNKAD